MNDLSPDKKLTGLKYFLRNTIRFTRKALIKLRLRKKFTYGKNVNFGPNSNLMVPDFFKIGSNFSCGKSLFVQTNLEIGNDCLISSDVSFVGHDHHINEENYNNYWSGRKPPSTVVIVGDNFIGYRSTIVGNITIGRGAIIAAGSVVVKDVLANTVVAGVPARQIGIRKK